MIIYNILKMITLDIQHGVMDVESIVIRTMKMELRWPQVFRSV
jgi:hypothetical protein